MPHGAIPHDTTPTPSAEPPAPDGERRLLARHRAGDAGAFAELVAAYRAPVFGYLVRCGVDAGDRDDLFQDIFLRVHRAAGRYQPSRPLHPWLFTIVANAVRNHLRARRFRQLRFLRPAAEPAEPPDPGPDGERTARGRETVAWLEREIRRLPLPQREVLLLATVEAMPLQDVAGALGIPLNTVKTRLRRARLRLARARARRHDAGSEATP